MRNSVLHVQLTAPVTDLAVYRVVTVATASILEIAAHAVFHIVSYWVLVIVTRHIISHRMVSVSACLQYYLFNTFPNTLKAVIVVLMVVNAITHHVSHACHQLSDSFNLRGTYIIHHGIIVINVWNWL
jgi:hypothetical protein